MRAPDTVLRRARGALSRQPFVDTKLFEILSRAASSRAASSTRSSGSSRSTSPPATAARSRTSRAR